MLGCPGLAVNRSLQIGCEGRLAVGTASLWVPALGWGGVQPNFPKEHYQLSISMAFSKLEAQNNRPWLSLKSWDERWGTVTFVPTSLRRIFSEPEWPCKLTRR